MRIRLSGSAKWGAIPSEGGIILSHKNKISLKMQANERFEKLIAYGQSKHDVKVKAAKEYDRMQGTKLGVTKHEYINAALRDKIYSYSTYDTYKKHNTYFLDWCKNEYKCKTLEQCREHVDEWLQKRIDANLSAYTIKMEAAALGKLYQEPTTNFIATPERERANITRSRGVAERDAHFSTEKNAEIITFAKSTGLRRSELESLRPDQLRGSQEEGYMLEIRGKGGKVRLAPIIGSQEAVEAVLRRIQATPEGMPVWERVPGKMDVHGYRAAYATEVYTMYARETEAIPKEDTYICRKDQKGIILDKKAMLEASKALGHNRIDVVAGHYIRTNM